MTKIYNDAAEVNAKLMQAVVEFGRRPIWAGQPMEDRAMAKSILIGMEKTGTLLLGNALQCVVTQAVKQGFVNNSRFVMPVNEGGKIDQTIFINNVIKEFTQVLGDGYTEYSSESILHYTWQSGVLDGKCRLDDLNCANGVYKGDYATA